MVKEHIKFIGSSLLAVLFALSIKACSLPSFSYNPITKNNSAEEIRKIIDSPKKLSDYLKEYGPQSFCVNTARLGCHLISDDGYMPMPLLFSKDSDCHCICAFRDKETGNYGFLDNGIWGYQKAKFDSVTAIADYIKNKKGFDMSLTSSSSLPKKEDYSSKEGLENLINILNQDKRETEISRK